MASAFARQRQALHVSNRRVGLGRVVVSTMQHLALLAPQGKGLAIALCVGPRRPFHKVLVLTVAICST
jgi:hypothetical protein